MGKTRRYNKKRNQKKIRTRKTYRKRRIIKGGTDFCFVNEKLMVKVGSDLKYPIGQQIREGLRLQLNNKVSNCPAFSPKIETDLNHNSIIAVDAAKLAADRFTGVVTPEQRAKIAAKKLLLDSSSLNA